MAHNASASWRTTAITAALGVLLGMAHLNASALALGPVTALSALGEPLVAGIAIPEINAEEFASLKATLATPEGFKAAGMEYNAALASAQFTLHRRPDGTTYLLLRSDKAVTDPFVNLVVTAKWSSGQIVRNYTLLLDPPAARPSEAAAVTAPVIATAPAPAPVAVQVAPRVETAPATVSASPAAPVAATRASTPAPVVAQVKPAPSQAIKPAATPSTKNSGEQIKVAGGDTAGKIAANNLPANVSLDQMLVAMLRGNPEAFVGNNVNRLKAGSILSLPSAEEAQATSTNTARQNVLAQSKDFNSFRRKLAENAPILASKTPDRQAGGKVEAKVEDKKTAAVTPDKLTLSKGSLNADSKAGAKDNSDKIAKERQAKDDAARVAELAKNKSDLDKIAAGMAAAPAVAAKPVAATPAASTPTASVTPTKPGTPVAPVAVTAPAAVAAAAASIAPTAPVAATVTAPATAPVATPPTAAAAPEVKPVVPAKPVVVAKAPVPEPNFMDDLMDNPAALPAAGGLLALLAAGGLYMAKKRKERLAAEDDEDSNADFEAQSFFHTTNHAIEPTHDVATETAAVVAGAAVHETVTEPTFTLPTMPEAAPAVAQTAAFVPLPEVTTLTPTPVIETIAPVVSFVDPEDNFPEFTPSEFSERTVAQLHPETAKSPASVDLDLDFDFGSGFQSPPAAPAVVADKKPSNILDFDMPSISPAAALAATAAAASTAAVVLPTAKAVAKVEHADVIAKAPDHAPLDFNMDSLSLDLNAPNKAAAAASAVDLNGPLETKLALAQEFRAIGDANGAKMLAQEVIALASGSLKIKAETLLAEIG